MKKEIILTQEEWDIISNICYEERWNMNDKNNNKLRIIFGWEGE